MRIRIIEQYDGVLGRLNQGQVLDVTPGYANQIPKHCWEEVVPLPSMDPDPPQRDPQTHKPVPCSLGNEIEGKPKKKAKKKKK